VTQLLDAGLFELQPGERVLWRGQPRQGFLIRGGDFLVAPLALAWGGFALYWEAGVIFKQHDPVLALFGIPFVAFGVWLVGGRWVWDAWARANTHYAVTTQRVIGRQTVFPAWYKADDLATLDGVSLDRRIRNNEVTLAFGPLPQYFGQRRDYYQLRYRQLRFERLHDGDAVAAIIEQARQDAKTEAERWTSPAKA